MSQLWSWALAAIGITGIWLAGRNNKLGWAIGLGAQLLWLAYALATRQWGFIATAFAYGFVYGRNWWKWHKAEREAASVSAQAEAGKGVDPNNCPGCHGVSGQVARHVPGCSNLPAGVA